MSHNAIENVKDLQGLYELDSLSTLDLSFNCLNQPDGIVEFFVLMRDLAVLYLKGNKGTKKITHYRKRLIYGLKNLCYLDDSPVQDIDRVEAEAWTKGKDINEAKKEFYAEIHLKKIRAGIIKKDIDKKIDAAKRKKTRKVI